MDGISASLHLEPHCIAAIAWFRHPFRFPGVSDAGAQRKLGLTVDA